MDGTLILAGGVLLMGAIQLLKKFGVDQKNATLALSAICGIGYFAYSNYVDPALQEQIMTDIVAIVGSAKILYDFITSLLASETSTGE